MIELTRILVGSLVLLVMINESYAECYDRDGTVNPNGLFCFNSDEPCWSSLDPSRLATMDNQFYLFTRELTGENKCSGGGNELSWDDPNTFGDISNSRETVVIIHGWTSSSGNEYESAMCDAFMELGDYNIIMVNWELAADNINYFRSKMDSRLVARELAVLLKKLHEHPGLHLDYANVHLVGHSLGAHLAGYTGDFLLGQIGHITGLDPARPDFKDYVAKPECVLDKTDADFVDVIHSDGSLQAYGLKEPLGHQDFYPNKGTFMQPKCLWKVACSHVRAYDFYLSSIKNFDIQPGQPCSFVTEACSGTTCSGTCPRMGIHAEKGDGSGSFSITMQSSNCGCAYIV